MAESTPKKLNLFDAIGSLSTKDTSKRDEYMDLYQGYMANKYFSNFRDTVLFANEMNILWNTPKDMNYDFYFHVLPKAKRYGKWYKMSQDDDVQVIMKAYGYNRQKALSVLPILANKIDEIKNEIYEGGLKK